VSAVVAFDGIGDFERPVVLVATDCRSRECERLVLVGVEGRPVGANRRREPQRADGDVLSVAGILEDQFVRARVETRGVEDEFLAVTPGGPVENDRPRVDVRDDDVSVVTARGGLEQDLLALVGSER